jgi:hypothetical protein
MFAFQELLSSCHREGPLVLHFVTSLLPLCDWYCRLQYDDSVTDISSSPEEEVDENLPLYHATEEAPCLRMIAG